MDDARISRILQWKTDEAPGPYMITLFPTNRCNLKCRHCWLRGATGIENTQELSDDRLLHLVDEAAELGVRDWVIIGGGEPLLRGDFIMTMAERIREHGMNGTLQTNATLLKREYAEHLIRIGWNRVNASIDGPNKEINDDIRGGGFEKATKNLKQLAELREKAGVQNPLTGLYTVVHARNYNRINEMVYLAEELGCSEGVTLTTLVVHSDEARKYMLTEEQRNAMPAILEEATLLMKERGMEDNFSFFMREDLFADPNQMNRVNTPVYSEGMGRALCYEPFLSMAITAEGKTGPCCAFWDETAQSIKDMSLRDVWLGSYLSNLRHGHWISYELPEYCRRCPSTLFCRNEKLRNEIHLSEEFEKWNNAGMGGRLHILTEKMARNLREKGLRESFMRGLGWLSIQKENKG